MPVLDTLKAAVLRLLGKDPFPPFRRSWGTSVEEPTFGNLDPILEEFDTRGEGLGLYARIRQEIPRIQGFFELRVKAQDALPHTWTAGDPSDPLSVELRDRYEDAWDQLPDRTAATTNAILGAIADGISFLAGIWFAVETAPNRSKNKQTTAENLPPLEPETLIVPQLIDKEPVEFDFDKQRNVVHLEEGGKTVLVDRRQIIVTRAGSAEIKGRAVMRFIYNDGWKFLEIDKMGLTALSKQGYPLAILWVPIQWTDDQIAQYAAPFKRQYPNMIVAFSEEGRKEIEIPNKDVSPTLIGRDQLDRQDWLIDSMSINILGIKFSNNQQGSMARDAVAERLLFDKVAGDAALYDHIANRWRDLVAEVNHPNVPRRLLPKMVTDTKPTADLVAWMNNLKTAVAMGFPASQQQIAEKQGFQVANGPDDALKAPAPAPVAQPFTPPANTVLPDMKPSASGLAVMSEEGEEITIPWARFAELIAQEKADA